MRASEHSETASALAACRSCSAEFDMAPIMIKVKMLGSRVDSRNKTDVTTMSIGSLGVCDVVVVLAQKCVLKGHQHCHSQM